MLVVEDHIGDNVDDWQAFTVMLKVPPEIVEPDKRRDKPPLGVEESFALLLSLPESIPLILLMRSLESSSYVLTHQILIPGHLKCKYLT